MFPFGCFIIDNSVDQLQSLGVISRESSIDTLSMKSVGPAQQQALHVSRASSSPPTKPNRQIVTPPLCPPVDEIFEEDDDSISTHSFESDRRSFATISDTVSINTAKPVTFMRPPTPPINISPIKSLHLMKKPSRANSSLGGPSRFQTDEMFVGEPSKQNFASIVRNFPHHNQSNNTSKLPKPVRGIKGKDMPKIPKSGSMHSLGSMLRRKEKRDSESSCSDDGKGKWRGKWSLDPEAPHGRDKDGKPLTIWDAL